MRFLQIDLKKKLVELLKDEFDIGPGDILFSIPPDRKFGDLSTTIPFVLAKKTREKPFVIGTRIIDKIKGKFPLFSDIQLAGGGFLNFYFARDPFFHYLVENRDRPVESKDDKVIVEHTSINPNKSAHIGHLRNACLGDTLARALRFLGYRVEVQNYLDDTGIQVADVVWGLLYYQGKSLEEIARIDNLASYLWYLYAEVNRLFESQEEKKEERNRVHQKIEDKIDPEYAINTYISQEVLKDHIRVMDAIGIRYDLLIRESDIIALDFFREAADLMMKEGIMYYSTDPDKQGCLVIKYRRENIEKIIVRSNRTVTYIGKDIAYALWKVGLFQEKDFYYREFFTYPDTGQEIYMSAAGGERTDFNFGKGLKVYNVIGGRQSYLQNIISDEVIGPISPAGSLREAIHFSYEMVALTPRCVEELGIDLPEEERKKAHVDVSGRKGIAVKADDLIDKLSARSLEEVKLRNPGLEEERALKIARDIAIGALRYFMIKFNASSIIAFDFKDALAFEGDTGPYLQYTLVRLNSILRKLGDENLEPVLPAASLSLLADKETAIFYEILLALSLVEVEVEKAVENRELSGMANYTYSLCQQVNHYYHLYPIIAEENLEIKNLRLTLVLLVKNKLKKLFPLLGIPVPEKM